MLPFMARSETDEHYVLDLCDEIIGTKCSRQHRFDWLLGDPSPTTGRQVALPVDGYWESENLVVEFAESQHTEPTKFFDKPDVLTVSGVHRGAQRALYDERRQRLIPEHGLRLVTIPVTEFLLKGRRIVRDRDRDLKIVERLLRQSNSESAIESALREFVAEREWEKFHSPENLAKSISIEAGELLECFQWDAAADHDRVVSELADVLTYCFLLADKLGVDADEIVMNKLEVTRAKYPVERSRGRSTKYDQL